MLLTCPYYSIPSPAASYWKELIPLVSPVVVIVLFIIDRLIGYKLRQKETDRSWYFKVLIEPGIEQITEFYRKVNTLYSDAAHNLDINKNISHDEFIKLKASEIFKFQEIKRELEAEIIRPIMSRYLFVGNSLTTVILNLEDLFTGYLDDEKFTNENIADFHFSAFTNRALLLNELYAPLHSSPGVFKRFWLWHVNKFSKSK